MKTRICPKYFVNVCRFWKTGSPEIACERLILVPYLLHSSLKFQTQERKNFIWSNIYIQEVRNTLLQSHLVKLALNEGAENKYGNKY